MAGKIDFPMQRVAVVRIVAIGQTFADIPTVPTLAISSGVTVMPIAMSFPSGAMDTAAAAVALLGGLAVLLSKRAAIRQTTLVGAWWWTAMALVAWSGVELAANRIHARELRDFTGSHPQDIHFRNDFELRNSREREHDDHE